MTYSSVSVTSAETTLLETNTASDGLSYLALDLINLASGDTYRIRVYRKVDGTNYRLEDFEDFTGVQTYPLVPLNAIWSNADMDLRVTAQKTAGTDRAIGVRTRTQF